MKSGLVLLSSFLTLAVASSSCAWALGVRRPVEPPTTEVCILGIAGCICYDPRTTAGHQIRPYGVEASQGGCLNYVATSPDDDAAIRQFHLDECYGRPRNGR